MTGIFGISRTATALVLVLGLAGCDTVSEGFSGMFGGDKPTEDVGQALPPPQPDSRGVVTYASYQVIVAQEGDTIPAMAGRVGLTADEVARHNGLPVTYSPRAGEVLALPRNVGGTPVTASIWSTEIAASAIDSAPAGAAGQTVVTSSVDNPFNNGQPAPVIDPVRHRVAPGETAFSIARTYGVSVTALASWNGLDNSMTVRENQELLIPVVNSTGAPAPTEAQVAANAPGTPSPVEPPPSATRPLPENQVASVAAPASPNLAQDRTPPGAQGRLLTPVSGASILRPYNPSGPNRNEGIDFAASAGSDVRAAETGEVALISESRGGLGTIVLIRHPDNLMTVYGRVTDVSLSKGDRVTRGQKIGVVAEGDPANVHFEVRRGTASVDPNPYLGL